MLLQASSGHRHDVGGGGRLVGVLVVVVVVVVVVVLEHADGRGRVRLRGRGRRARRVDRRCGRADGMRWRRRHRYRQRDTRVNRRRVCLLLLLAFGLIGRLMLNVNAAGSVLFVFA